MDNLICDYPTYPNVNYTLASRSLKPEGTRIEVSGITIGSDEFVVMAGPCAVESEEQLLSIADFVCEHGAKVLRGGAFKPRTSPFSFQGLEKAGLELLAKARERTGLPIVTEVMDTRQVGLVHDYADIFQVGSRSMQNFPLLKEVGKTRKPVLFKRGMSATIDEYLLAAEYILDGGNEEVILCERGIRTFETSTRSTLDLNAIPVLKQLSHLPVLADPSHGTGHAWMVPTMARAALAAGADGLLVEVHNHPETALCDGKQSLSFDSFEKMMTELAKVAQVIGRKMNIPLPV